MALWDFLLWQKKNLPKSQQNAMLNFKQNRILIFHSHKTPCFFQAKSHFIEIDSRFLAARVALWDFLLWQKKI